MGGARMPQSLSKKALKAEFPGFLVFYVQTKRSPRWVT